MNLEQMRQLIDQLNADIIALFSKRLDVAKEIAKLKKCKQLPVYDAEREQSQREELRVLAVRYGLSPAVIEEMFTLFVEYTKIMEKMEMEPKR